MKSPSPYFLGFLLILGSGLLWGFVVLAILNAFMG